VPAPSPDDVTALLRRARDDPGAREELFRLVADELRQRAHAWLSRQPPDPALQTTVLIDDAFLKLVGGRAIAWQDRAQFYRLAARAMKQVLVDYARRRRAAKGGGGVRPDSLADVPEPAARGGLAAPDLLALEETLVKLAREAPDLAEVVELHHFGGWDLKQVAQDILGLSPKQVERRWQMALAWLYRELNPKEERHES
jgi:RNA polymerase sigma factor (TIGR02999 family)